MSNVAPQIRFKGFTDAWKQRKLRELAAFNPKEELPDVFEYVDLESVVGTEMLFHRTEEKSTAPSRAQRLAYTGDLFYQTVRPYQKNNYLFEKPDKHYVFSTGYAQLRPFVDGYFLLSLVQSGQFVKTVSDNCTGTSYPSINATDLAEIGVFSPKNEREHHQIGTYFRHLDTLITLHQRKCDKLEAFKKSCLQNMFPRKGETVPKIRLKGFSEEWKNKKAGLLFKEIVQKNFPNLPVLSASQEFGMIRRDDIGINLSYDKNNLKNYKRIREGQFAIHLASFQSGFAHSPIDGITSPAYTVLDFKEKDEHCDLFWKRVLTSNAFISDLKQITYGIRVGKSIDYNEFLGLSFCYPTLEEQQKIAEFFMSLDEKIRLEKLKYDKLKDLKSFCLQKMFA